MTKSLRKAHLLSWGSLAFLLPGSIIIAWLSIPEELPQVLLQPGASAAMPVILKSTQTDNYTISIRSDADRSHFQLEWVNKKGLQSPSAFIYVLGRDKNLKDAKLIGRIAERGTYYFPLDSTFNQPPGKTDHFVLYDRIQQQVIDSINLKQ